MSGKRMGMTLIEWLTVIALMAMVVGLAVPTFHRFQNKKNYELMREQLFSDLQLAQSYAKATGQDCACVWAVDSEVLTGRAYAIVQLRGGQLLELKGWTRLVEPVVFATVPVQNDKGENAAMALSWDGLAVQGVVFQSGTGRLQGGRSVVQIEFDQPNWALRLEGSQIEKV